MKKLMAVLSTQESAKQVLATAKTLAQALNADLHVYKPCYDTIYELNRYIGFDNYDDLEKQVIDLDREWVKSLVDDMDFGGTNVTTAVTWSKKYHEGVIEQEQQQKCDLMIKAADVHHRIAEVVRTPEEWHLLREAQCPVLLQKENGLTGSAPTFVVAINSLENDDPHYQLHQRVVTSTQALANALGGRIVVVCAGPMIPYSMPYATEINVQYPQLQEELLKRARDAMDEFLQKNNVQASDVIIDSGNPEDIIHKVCNREDAALLSIGTVANTGLSNVFLGNTSERVIHHVSQSVMVVS